MGAQMKSAVEACTTTNHPRMLVCSCYVAAKDAEIAELKIQLESLQCHHDYLFDQNLKKDAVADGYLKALEKIADDYCPSRDDANAECTCNLDRASIARAALSGGGEQS